MWTRIRNWRWALAIVALLGLALTYSFWPEKVSVDMAGISRGPMMIGITDDGVTRVHDLYTVTAPVPGYVTRIELEPGDTVVAGSTVIARMQASPSVPLDTRSRAELVNAIAAARAAETSASAALTLARAELGRAEQLAERGFLPLAQLDARRAAAQSREADLQRTRAETRRLQATLANGSGTPSGSGAIAVRSPESGVVLRRVTESEGAIAQGTPLIEIGDPAKIEVVIDLLSREAVQVSPGDEVLITRWGGEDALPGRVRLVEPFGRLKVSALGIEEQRVNVIVDFEPQVAQQIAALGHGYQVDGTMVLWRDDDVLRAPVGALFRGADGEWQVFVDDDGRARLRTVRLGHINDEHAEVLEGLEAGEQVVLNPGSMVEDSTPIAAR